MTQISEQESLTNKTYLTKNISESDISDYIKKKMPVYTKSLNEPPTSRLWASFIGRNLILGPVADLLAIKAYDKGTMADLLIAHLFTTVDDTKNLVKRYDDKKNNAYIEPKIPKPKHKLSEIIKEPPHQAQKIAKEHLSYYWKKYGLPQESFLTAVPIVLFDIYALGINRFIK